MRVGEHDLDAAIAQAKDKVNKVSFKLEHLIEEMEQIVREQNYQRVSLWTRAGPKCFPPHTRLGVMVRVWATHDGWVYLGAPRNAGS